MPEVSRKMSTPTCKTRESMMLTLLLNDGVSQRLREAFVEAYPGRITCLPAHTVPEGGPTTAPCWRLCVGPSLALRIRRLGWREGLIVAVTRQEFEEIPLMFGPRDSLLFHDVPRELLRISVRLAVEGLTVLPRNLTAGTATLGAQLRGFHQLGAEDRAIMAALTLGLSNRQIAARLDYPLDSVRMSVDRMLRELGCRNRTEIAVLAHRRLSAFLDLPNLPPLQKATAIG